MEMWISKGWNRPLPLPQLSAVGQVTWWALLVYFAMRIVDLALGERLLGVFGGGRVALLVGELVLGGVVPLVLLATRAQRAKANVLFWGALLAMGGIVLNRIDIVLFAQQLKGPMPGFRADAYFPSVAEWGVSIGLIAATVFLFGLAARHMPMLTKSEVGEAH
jgi:formate dehydrogenase iron-sulfur subunit